MQSAYKEGIRDESISRNLHRKEKFAIATSSPLRQLRDTTQPSETRLGASDHFRFRSPLVKGKSSPQNPEKKTIAVGARVTTAKPPSVKREKKEAAACLCVKSRRRIFAFEPEPVLFRIPTGLVAGAVANLKCAIKKIKKTRKIEKKKSVEV